MSTKHQNHSFRPEFAGFAQMTPEQRLAAKRQYNRQHYLENQEKLKAASRERARRTKGAEPTRPAPALCEACGALPSGKFNVLHADHNHAQPYQFRGWLCACCNLTLGQAQDSPARLRALANYLER